MVHVSSVTPVLWGCGGRSITWLSDWQLNVRHGLKGGRQRVKDSGQPGGMRTCA